ncbi:TetR/AcrR family transcriptional regulator [Alsobacter soli]|uniref:TetR/AcrR family transcriptional regulator n=1 Tax=Alsobacter soli TaxID=2109933 RepID=A0A2T1HMQ1_9HYPH|nr:TetR/AcrR family transcriptional regulator [Alsobacter soli]PSC02903.1 TetR/AcrR family transcriptional regulator [Alsobacter soli]
MSIDSASAREARPRAAKPKKPPIKKSEATRARILDAAAYVFRRKGYAHARLSDIAKKARTQTSSIYYYFESREAIVSEVLRIANEKTASYVNAAISEQPVGATARERITAAIHGHFRIVLSDNDYTSAHMRIFDQIPEKLQEHFLKVLDQNAGIWRDLFDAARAEGAIAPDVDLSVLRLLLLGMMNWSIEWFKPGRMSVDQIADQAARLFFDGAGPPRAPAP